MIPRLFKKTANTLDSKSKAIAMMYLSKSLRTLQDELNDGSRQDESEVFTAKHDIQCLQRTIEHLRT
jgi:hypothetical protein